MLVLISCRYIDVDVKRIVSVGIAGGPDIRILKQKAYFKRYGIYRYIFILKICLSGRW